MTREENLHWINEEIRTWENECQSKHPIKEALYAARKVLEQEPCKDCISRQAVLEYIEGSEAELGHISENELVCQDIKELPSVTPAEKVGHWIDTDEWRETVDGFEQWGYFRKCSECGYVFKFLEIDNYCPNCGEKMVEPQAESEVDNAK